MKTCRLLNGGEMMQLTDSNYYSTSADQYYFSVSQYKSFCKCEAAAMAQIYGKYERPMTRALLVGSFVDAYFEGTLEEFMEKNPSVFTRKNELRSEFKKAKLAFRVDKLGSIHLPIGKADFAREKIRENFKAFLDQITRLKPASSKGQYLRTVALSLTMGPAIKMDPALVAKYVG